MNKRNLFIVASPLQFLNAIEARETFKTANNVLILMYDTKENINDANQKKKLLIQEDWDKVIHYNLGNISKYLRFFFQVKLIKFLLKYQYRYIFSGEFGIMNQAIMSNLQADYIYLLDDGNATIFTYEKLKDKEYFSKISFSKKIRLLRYLSVNLKYKINQDINFFTTFDIKSIPHIKVIQHDFHYLKLKKLKNCKKDNCIYLLGQNLSEIKFMKKEVYLKYLKNIKKAYKEDIIYIPHRSEEITSEYDFLIDDTFKIQHSKGPIEATLINENIYPKIIISFVSSALFNLDKIFSDTDIYAVKIDPNDLISNKSVIESCYDFFNNTGVSIINLPS